MKREQPAGRRRPGSIRSMAGKWPWPAAWAMLLAILLVQGCAGPGTASRTFVRKNVDLAYVTRVAVLPFTNNTQDDFAAQRIRDITATQIMAMGIFDVVDRGIVDSALREMAIDKDTPLDVPVVKRLGKRLGVQAFVLGTVNSIGENRRGSFSYPEVSLTLELLDSDSAQVLWRCSDTLSGYSLADRLFGLAPRDAFQITVDLLQRMLATIPK
ncbi:MAG TPA: hypothetical protein ENK27_00950 [Desulfobulbus sp.]|nr:hypothetical protein [Desulfobulbus sp.]